MSENSDGGKSFRERVEEIRRQRAEAAEPSGTSASGDEMDADTGDTEIYAPDSTEDTAIYTEDLEVSGVSTTDFDSNFCPSCGTDISSLDDGSFCPQCGSSLPA